MHELKRCGSFSLPVQLSNPPVQRETSILIWWGFLASTSCIGFHGFTYIKRQRRHNHYLKVDRKFQFGLRKPKKKHTVFHFGSVRDPIRASLRETFLFLLCHPVIVDDGRSAANADSKGEIGRRRGRSRGRMFLPFFRSYRESYHRAYIYQLLNYYTLVWVISLQTCYLIQFAFIIFMFLYISRFTPV